MHECMSSDLSLKKHVSAVSAACFFISGKFVVSDNHWTLGQQQHSFTHLWHLDRVDHCNVVLAGSPRFTTDKLQRVMNSAARVVSNTRKFDSGLSRLSHDGLHWLDVTDQVRFKLALLMYGSLHGMAPPYLVNSCTQTAGVAASAVRQSAEVDRSALSPEEQLRSSVFCLCGPVDLEFATWQSLRHSTESQHV